MTKKRRHKQRVARSAGNHGQGQKKKRRIERYWIEDCPETTPTTSSLTQQQQPGGYNSICCFTVWITRVELWDDHHRIFDNNAGASAAVTAATVTDSIVSNEKVATKSASSPTTSTDRLEQSDLTKDCTSTATSTTIMPMPKNENEVVAASSSLGDSSAPPAAAESTSTLVLETTPLLAMATSTATMADHDSEHSSPAPVIGIQRAASALKPRSTPTHNPKFKLLPHGDCGDGIKNPHPPDMVDDKYWAQRRRLFSKFDQGISMDTEGWYSVTPEVIANHIARRIVGNSSNNSRESHPQHPQRLLTVIDAFGGVGGNTVALCQHPQVERVVCVDTDDKRLRMAANNCRVYGIPAPKVVFVHANACSVLKSYKHGQLLQELRLGKGQHAAVEEDYGSLEASNNETAASSTSATVVDGYAFGSSLDLLPSEIHAIFLSPPWGGPEVVEETGPRAYGLDCIHLDTTATSSNNSGGEGDENDNDGSSRRVVDGEDVLRMAFQALPPSSMNVAFFLPRNTNGKKIAISAIQAGFRGCMELEANILNCKLKTITAYFGSHMNPA